MRVQVAFQGGGARVAALLAAVQALRELHDVGTLEVTRVAGTSAGAIAAVLFASGADLGNVRQKVVTKGDRGIRRLFPERSELRQFLIAAMGAPLYDVGRLRKLLKELLDGHVDEETNLGQLRTPTLITVADAASGKKRVLAGDYPVLNAMIDSSALPFVFREASALKDNAHLDGGLCENLPTEELLKEPSYGEVIAISFEPESKELPNGPKSLAMRILELSIENSVQRAIRDVGEQSVCRLRTSLRTFDFGRVCSAGFHEDPFNRVRLETRNWLEAWLRRQSSARRRVATELPAHEFMSRLGSVYKVLRSEVEVICATMIVVANELRSREEANEIFNFRLLRPKTELRCWMSGLVPSGTPMDEGEWIVRDSSGAVRDDFISIPARDPAYPDNFRGVLLFFRQPLPAGQECRITRNSSELHSFAKLFEKGEDDIFHTNSGDRVVLESHLILVVPGEWEIVNARFESGVAGEEIPLNALRELYDGYVNRNGMKVYGWRARNVQPQETFRVWFSARRPAH